MKVVCVGDCGIDLYLPSGEKRVGGITANFARHAREQFPTDDSIRIISCVGDDGEVVLEALQGTGIDLDIERIPGATPMQWIEVQPDGERLFTKYDAGVLGDLGFDERRQALVAESDLLVAPVYLQIVGVFDALMSIETEGSVAVDFADFLEHPNYELLSQHIDRVDIGFFGLQPDHDLAPLRSLARKHDKLFLVTLGASGSVGLSPAGDIEVPAFPVAEVLDTTGAGDAYAAGFLASYCHGAGLEAAMRHGSEVAASVVSRLGAY